MRLDRTTCDRSLVGATTFFFRNQYNCDSIVIITTRLLRSDTIRLFSTTCNALDTGTTTRRLQNNVGCDSLIFTTKRFSNADTTRLFSKSCNVRDTGTTIRRLQNIRGCDSIVIMQTTLVPNSIRLGLIVSFPITCNGGNDGSIKLSSIQNGTPQYQTTWSNGAKGIQIDSLKAGIYTVSVTDSLGCQAKDSIRLTEPPPIVTTAKGIAPRCYTEGLGTIQIDAIQGGTAPYTLVFQNNRFPIAILPRRIDSIRLGFHILQIVDSKSCRSQVSVEVPEAPDRSLELGSDRAILLGDSTILMGFTNFTPKSRQWTWTPKDSSVRCPTCFPTSAKPTETTTYTLLLKDSLGCEVSDHIVITVNKPRHVFIPTTFSPNNDLVNDYFTIFGDISVKKVQSFKIFNRWGDAIFDRTDFPLNIETQGWDGSAKGTAMPPDVYIYVAVVEFIDGKVVVYRGDITLVR